MLFPLLQVPSRSRTALEGFRRTGWTMTPRTRIYSVAAYSVLLVFGIVQKGNMLIRWLISCLMSITAFVLSWPIKHGSLESF